MKLDNVVITPKRITEKVNLFIIGVNKAGTTWLHGLLGEHPDVFMSSIKELNYFGVLYPNGLEKYHQNFNFNLGLRYYGESSTSYFRNPDVAEQINEYNPKAKVMVMLRDPVERLLSHFYFSKQLGEIPEKVTLEDILDNQNHYMKRDSHYECTIPKFENIFRHNFYVNRLEIALSNTEIFWSEILKYLSLSEVPLPEESKNSKNVTGGKGFRYIYRKTILPIKKKKPDLYQSMLDSTFMKFSRKSLIDLFGKAEKDAISPTVKERLVQEFEETYRYLDSQGLTWNRKVVDSKNL